MIELTLMTADEYAGYMKSVVQDYAQDIANNSRIPLEQALARSSQQIEGLLKDGPATAGHFLYTIRVPHGETRVPVGHLWIYLDKDKGSCFIYDIVIKEPFRGWGCGSQVLELLENMMAEQHVQRIELHVFGDNTRARKLYQKMGYQVVGMHMQKLLGDRS